MMLSSQTIRKYCGNYGMVRRPGRALEIEPVSIDIHLAEVAINGDVIREGSVELLPGVFCLGSTEEIFHMPDHITGFVVGKSSRAREGLQIEAAGLVDPTFRGHITLELKNLHHEEVFMLEIGDSIGQAYFVFTDEPVDTVYGPRNHYQDQCGVTPSYRKALA